MAKTTKTKSGYHPGFEDAAQPMISGHPLVTGNMPMFAPHRPEKPEKSEGGVLFKLASDFEPMGDQPTAIKELVGGISEGL